MSNARKPRNTTKAKTKALDFDALRKKKESVLGEIPPVKIGGKSYTLKPSMPLSVTDYFAENSTTKENGDVAVLLSDMQYLLRELFGEAQWAEIRSVIDLDDVPDLFTLVFDAYGESVGEASNSGQS